MKNHKDDPEFQELVDKIYAYMEMFGYSLSEVREAALIAAIRYEIAHKDDPPNPYF